MPVSSRPAAASPFLCLFRAARRYYSAAMRNEPVLTDSPDWMAVYAARRDRLRLELRARGLDAMLISHAANRFYFSGFELHDSQPGETAGMLLITASGDDWLATDSRYAEAAAACWPGERVFIYGGEMAKDLAALLRRHGAVTGIETKSLGVAFFRALRGFAAPALVAADGLAEKQRMLKEPCEIAALRASFALNHAMLKWLESDLGRFIGRSESWMAWEVEKFFRENGAQELAFATICATGRNGAKPHAIPGAELVPANGPLLVDAGCRVRSYCSDQTRSWWVGSRPLPEFTRALDLAREAQRAAIAVMRPGVPCAEVYAAARRVFEDAGAAEAFTHGLGHGVGLETHEAPSLSPRSRQVLQKGMVVTVEPGLYYPAWGGVRWEHTVLVEEDGVSVF